MCSTIRNVFRYVKFWRRDKLMVFIIIGVLLGFLVGLACNDPIQKLQEPNRSTALSLLGFPGAFLLEFQIFFL